MSQQKQDYIMVTCKDCGSELKLQKNATDLFCINCKSWLSLEEVKKLFEK